jgi:hypothetical protein
VKPVSATPTRPVDYAAISATYGTLLGSLALAARRSRAVGRHAPDEPLRPGEIAPIGVAAFALSKLLAKEKVETWVRQPFVEEEPTGERTPKGDGMRYAVGELLSCTRCLGAWSSLGLVALRVTRPSESRVVTTVLAASAVNDFLQAGFTWLNAETNVTEREARSPAPGAEHPVA